MRGPSSEREGRRGSPHSRTSLAMSNHAVGVSPDVYTPRPDAYFVKRGQNFLGKSCNTKLNQSKSLAIVILSQDGFARNTKWYRDSAVMTGKSP